MLIYYSIRKEESTSILSKTIAEFKMSYRRSKCKIRIKRWRCKKYLTLSPSGSLLKKKRKKLACSNSKSFLKKA